MEEENTNRKIPNTSFSIFLFLFFYQLIRVFFRDVPLLWNTWRDVAIAEDEPLLLSFVLGLLYVVFLLLSFWSIIRVLKGKPDGIACMRWALVFSILISLYNILQSFGKIVCVHWNYALLPVFHLLLAVLFLTYLARSKSMRELFPKTERRYKLGGWAWVSYTVVCLGLLTISLSFYIGKEKKTGEIPIASLSLPDNSHCDGMIMFESPQTWDTTEIELADMKYEGEYQTSTLFYYESDSIVSQVWCGISEKTRHSDYVSVMLQMLPSDKIWTIQEGAICDTIIGNDQYYIEQYKYDTDSLHAIWTFAIRFDSSSNKYCAYSQVTRREQTDDEFKNSIRFLESVVFDLTQYKK